jgi:DNA-binding response OmpR family regulator
MTATINAAILPFVKPKTEFDSNPMHFLDEALASVPVSGVLEEFRKLSRFLPVIVLVPKSAVGDKDIHNAAGRNDSVPRVTGHEDVSSPLDAAKAWFRNSSTSDTFEFGEVTGCFSRVEIHRHGRPVVLTYKEFKTLEYLVKNAGRVISRDELLNKVWGYQNYPCTRTVDNHILKLRQKLERNPSRPVHFLTVQGAGYKFLINPPREKNK